MKKGLKKIFLASLLCASFFSVPVLSQEDGWDDDWQEQEESQVTTSGFLEAGFGDRLDDDSLFDESHTLNEFRFFLQSELEAEDYSLNFKGETWYDGVLDNQQYEIRDLSVSFSLFGTSDFKVGRQVSTWGTGDLLFVNDQFAKGWPAYFNGRDDNYVKAAANAVRVNNFFNWVNLDIVWTPEFTPNEYLTGERFSFFSPLADGNIGGSEVIKPLNPNGDELAFRLYKTHNSTEYAFYYYDGYNKQPTDLIVDQSNNLRPSFSKRSVIGASIRGNAWDGLYNIEVAYNDAKEDPKGVNPLIENSKSVFLVGYETELLPKLNVSFQYYLEWIDSYHNLITNSLAPQFETRKRRGWITNRITYRMLQDKLSWTFFTFYSPSDKDGFLRWNLNYRQNDDWSYTLGLNYLDGEQSETFFAQFKEASNIYARVRYNF